MEFEDIIAKGIKYVEHVREETSKHKVNNPGFISLLACLAFADEHNIDFNYLVDALYIKLKYRTVDKFRNDFAVYKNFRSKTDLALGIMIEDKTIH